jgi:proline racemase
MEVPAGLVSLTPRFGGDHVESIALETPPAFVHTPSAKLEFIGNKAIQVSIVFSGVFFVLVDVVQLDIPRAGPDALIGPQNATALASLGAEILEVANRAVVVQHPQNPEVNTIELVMLFEQLDGGDARDIVINRSGGIDRSPCGGGTGARVTDLFSKGALEQ